VLDIGLHVRRYYRAVPRDLEEYVLGDIGADLEPARIVECSGIDAADFGSFVPQTAQKWMETIFPLPSERWP